jgi:hypothetical protein
MKHTYSLVIALIAFSFSFAAPKIQLANSYGIWAYGQSWDLNRVPANGDTIIIPANSTLVVANDVALNNVHMRIYGKLALINNNSQINFDSQSDIIVFASGRIEGDQASQKIRIGGNVVYQGNKGVIAGPSMATVASIGFQAGVLPVKFLGFNVARKGADVFVQWSTSEEVNAYKYELERSFDAANWNTISYITAAGNSNNMNNYSYTDKSVGSRTVYYRVKQVDRDGKYSYTSVRSIKADASNVDIKVASAQNRLVLQFPQEIKSGVSVRLVSLNGQVVKEQRIEQAIGQVIMNIGVKGNYVVSVTNGNDVNVATKVIL